MSISGSTLVVRSRRCMENRRWPRTVCADATTASFLATSFCRSSGRFTHSDLDDRKSTIIMAVSACNFHVDIWSIPGVPARRNKLLGGCTQGFSGKRLLRRADSQGTVGTLCVVPCRERIDTALNNPPFAGGAGYGKITPVLRNSVGCLAVAGCLEA